MIENITSRLRYCSSLPTIPGIAMRIVDLANRPDTNIVQISDYVSMDPALSAKFLRVARSPLYMTRRSATNVRQAISLMGTHASIMIALSFSLIHSMKDRKNSDHINLDLFWRRSLLSALSARALGEKLGYKKLDDLFLAGLLQDVGILAFDALMPTEYEKVCLAALSHDELLQAERKTFGAGHDEVGYWLLKQWKLPDYLALSCLANHSLTQEKEAMSKMTSCVAVSSCIADHFLNSDDLKLKERAYDVAAEYLELDQEALSCVLDTIAARLPAAEELFDIRLIDPVEVDSVMTEARDLQMLRQLSRDMELERGTLRDALTGLHNHSYLDSILRREFELSTRNNWPLSIAMINLDHLRQINNTYGHLVGDSVLISIVRNVQGQIRPDDIFARYHGENFVLVMPGAALDQTELLMERLLESISNIEHKHDSESSLKVTVSIGVAAHMDGATQFTHPGDFIKAVDDALIQAKSTGRNRVTIWSGQQ
jgi:diguanylate cyclase (GGDEF)-like protein